MARIPEGTPPELIAYVRSFPTLSEDQVAQILELCVLEDFPKGTLLQQEGAASTRSYTIFKGCIREYVLIDGEEKSTAFFTEGETVNSYASQSRERTSGSFLVCLEDCTLGICEENLEAILTEMVPELKAIVKEELERESFQSRQDFNRYIASTPRERYQYLQEHRPGLLQRVPQHQIASYIGVSPETLSRIRKRMARESLSD